MTKSIDEIYTGRFKMEDKNELIKELLQYPNVTGVDIVADGRLEIHGLCVDFAVPILIEDKFLGKKHVQTLAVIQEHAKFEYRPKELTLIIG